jgi:hypothetical protein
MVDLSKIKDAVSQGVSPGVDAVLQGHLDACMARHSLGEGDIFRAEIAGGTSYEAEIGGISRRLCVTSADVVICYHYMEESP